VSEQWTTRLDPEATASYGVKEIHGAWFTPRKMPPLERNMITLLIPECEIQFVLPKVGVMVNRPQANRNLKHWLCYACKEACDLNAVLFICCDTADQVQRAAKMAAKLLPNYERAALERIYDEATRSRAGFH
jgi:hypothetical protein